MEEKSGREKLYQGLGIFFYAISTVVLFLLFLALFHYAEWEIVTLLILCYIMYGMHLVVAIVHFVMIKVWRNEKQNNEVSKRSNLFITSIIILFLMAGIGLLITTHVHKELHLSVQDYCTGGSKAGEDNANTICTQYDKMFKNIRGLVNDLNNAHLYAHLMVMILTIWSGLYIFAFAAVFAYGGSNFESMFPSKFKDFRTASNSSIPSVTPRQMSELNLTRPGK